jgi:flagellar basal-body rod protein FlgF
MDRLIYVAMTGAKNLMHKQEILANNLANANTTGFRADLNALRAVPVQGQGMPTRVFVVESTPGNDFAQGPVQHTGSELDAVVNGAGWFAVEGLDGTEGYTRAGAFERGPEGLLQTRSGRPVLGEGGPITLPDNARIEIGSDGTVSAIAADNSKSVSPVGRLKLVNPPEADLVKGDDGLFRLRDGASAAADPAVRLTGGALEGSNVNVVETMIGMISLSRQFEMQMKLLQEAQQNSASAGKLMSNSQ